MSDSFRFLDLPAELRNCIYELLVAPDDVEINVFQKLPPITQASKQLRNESMVIFLGCNKFVVDYAAENTDYLVHWLDSVGNLKYLKLLSIDCTACLARISEDPLEYQGAFRRWHELVACLAAFGLKPSQLRWFWGPHIDLPTSKAHVFWDVHHIHFFSKYTLEPLLKDHDLFGQGDTFNFNVPLALEDAEKSEHSDDDRKAHSREAIESIAMFEETFESWKQCCPRGRSPPGAYVKYIRTTFNEGHAMLGRFHDLKYLHKKSGVIGYKDTADF